MDPKAMHLVGEQPRKIKATYPAGIPGPLLQSLGYPNKPGVVTRHQALGLVMCCLEQMGKRLSKAQDVKDG